VTGNEGSGRSGGGVGINGSRRTSRPGVGAGSRSAHGELSETTTRSKAESGIGDDWIGSRPAATLAATVKVPATMSDAAAISLERDARIREARRAGFDWAPGDVRQDHLAGVVRCGSVRLQPGDIGIAVGVTEKRTPAAIAAARTYVKIGHRMAA